jgi:hypothetical protein
MPAGLLPCRSLCERPSKSPLLLGLYIFTFLVLLAFAAIYIVVFSCTLNVGALCRSAKLDGPQILSVSTVLTGLVGGVVAVALAQQQGVKPTSNGNGGASSGNGGGTMVRHHPRSRGLWGVVRNERSTATPNVYKSRLASRLDRFRFAEYAS